MTRAIAALRPALYPGGRKAMEGVYTMWDFSIWQRAEAIWQEAHNAAAEQRLAKQAQGRAGRRPARAAALMGRVAGRLAGVFSRSHVKQAAGTLAFLFVVNAVATATADAAPPAYGIRALAENILGRGTVKFVRVADEGATVVIRWESATYKPANSQAVTRELLYAEAALATGAILGPLPTVARVKFVIVHRDRVLASGETWRVRGLTMAYADALGGGTYTEDSSKVGPAAPGSDRTATEI